MLPIAASSPSPIPGVYPQKCKPHQGFFLKYSISLPFNLSYSLSTMDHSDPESILLEAYSTPSQPSSVLCSSFPVPSHSNCLNRLNRRFKRRSDGLIFKPDHQPLKTVTLDGLPFKLDRLDHQERCCIVRLLILTMFQPRFIRKEFLPNTADPGSFETELYNLNLLNNLKHPNIVELLGSWTYRGKYNALFLCAKDGDLF